MKGNVDLSVLLRGFSGFMRRFHTLLFFLIVSGGLFVAILMLLNIINLSSSTAESSDQTINGTFDEPTIQRLEQDATVPITPGGRVSPFVE